jgi:glutamate-ammonia-ligase adenylyltransferase
VDPADLFLSPDLTEEQARAYLTSLGFRDAAAVDECFQRVADDLVARQALGRLAADLFPALLEAPDADLAALNVAQYLTGRTGRAMLLDYLREDPRALHVITYVMGASPLLSEILIRTPEYFHWLVSQVERSAPDRQDHEEELVSAFATVDDPFEGLNLLRRWKRRETLRIGTRELLRHETVQTASAQLSDVAAVAVDFALAIVMQQRLDAAGLAKPPGSFAVIGTGQLGSFEMSYGPEIDLLYVFEPDPRETDTGAVRDFFVRVGCDLTAALRDDTRDGVLYRVMLPPWPQTDGWLRACSLEDYADRYGPRRHEGTKEGALPDATERLSLARARPVAGDAQLGARFVAQCQSFLYGSGHNGLAAAVTPASGGQEIETLTKVFQVAHGAQHAPLRGVGTLGALDALRRAGLLEEQTCRELDHAYVFLRSAEHRHQLGLHDRDIESKVAASAARVREICSAVAGLANG